MSPDYQASIQNAYELKVEGAASKLADSLMQKINNAASKIDRDENLDSVLPSHDITKAVIAQLENKLRGL